MGDVSASLPLGACGYAAKRGTISIIKGRFLNTGEPTQVATAEWQPSLCPNTRATTSPRTAVILHLHSCYVSKAAILTVPAKPVPVENRSPA
jgi:hypothetical protein